MAAGPLLTAEVCHRDIRNGAIVSGPHVGESINCHCTS